MGKYYLLMIFATLLLAVEFSLQKLYQRQCGTSPRAGLTFNAISGLVSAVIFFAVSGFRLDAPLYAVMMALCMSLCLVGYTLLGFRVLKAGNMALYTMFLMTGGMTVPYVWGLVFLDEPFRILRLLGLLVIIAAIILSNLGTKRSNMKILLLCCIIFFLNGGCSVSSKLSQTENPYGIVSPTVFVCLTGMLRFALCGIALLLTKKSDDRAKQPITFLKILPIIVGAATVNGIFAVLELVGAANLPATVLYPIVSGGSIIFSTLADTLLFHEKPNLHQKIGVGLCFLGTCLFL